MIHVTRLDGRAIVVNAELIATVEATPDTIVTLVNGARILVQESTDEVVQGVIAYRRALYEAPVKRN
ncbi:flagellar FlbD family protein [Vulgatibacter incomptus]|uniref:Flagellar protein FlbD n=1 Tax=Vulgatibacter incomptus TaxID=1391653 RepID=A0A0K1PHM4_9BACT|nr:flagellar FlbD family protein [Vulgatibacter incomptus]AKU93020.1 Flagellar protein FlbD [Vulgatibacter incomptus]